MPDLQSFLISEHATSLPALQRRVNQRAGNDDFEFSSLKTKNLTITKPGLARPPIFSALKTLQFLLRKLKFLSMRVKYSPGVLAGIENPVDVFTGIF
jgi:hypothetical protein